MKIDMIKIGWNDENKTGMKNLISLMQALVISLLNGVQDMDERVSDVEDKIEEMDISVKEDVKSKHIQAQNI